MGQAVAGLVISSLIVEAEADATLPDLVKAHLHLILRRLYKYHDRTRIQGAFRVSVIDMDELFQTCLVALWEASLRWETIAHQKPFENYANGAISNALSTLRERSEQLGINDALITDLIGDKDPDTLLLVDDATEREYKDANTTLLLLDFVRTLTPHQRKVLHYLLCGLKQAEIGVALSLDRRNINKTVNAIKTHVKTFALANGFSDWLVYFPEVS